MYTKEYQPKSNRIPRRIWLQVFILIFTAITTALVADNNLQRVNRLKLLSTKPSRTDPYQPAALPPSAPQILWIWAPVIPALGLTIIWSASDMALFAATKKLHGLPFMIMGTCLVGLEGIGVGFSMQSWVSDFDPENDAVTLANAGYDQTLANAAEIMSIMIPVLLLVYMLSIAFSRDKERSISQLRPLSLTVTSIRSSLVNLKRESRVDSFGNRWSDTLDSPSDADFKEKEMFPQPTQLAPLQSEESGIVKQRFAFYSKVGNVSKKKAIKKRIHKSAILVQPPTQPPTRQLPEVPSSWPWVKKLPGLEVAIEAKPSKASGLDDTALARQQTQRTMEAALDNTRRPSSPTIPSPTIPFPAYPVPSSPPPQQPMHAFRPKGRHIVDQRGTAESSDEVMLAAAAAATSKYALPRQQPPVLAVSSLPRY